MQPSDRSSSVYPSPAPPTPRRWCNQLNPEVKKDPFSQWEDAVIIKAHKEHGNKWAREWEAGREGAGHGMGAGSRLTGCRTHEMPGAQRAPTLMSSPLAHLPAPLPTHHLQSSPSCCQAAPTMR